MKLLLTDSGVRNASILAALVDLLGKPIAEASALCIPTADFGTSERFWMNLQARYDLEIEKDRLGAALDGIRPLSAAS